MTPEQREIYRKMTPEQKLIEAERLYFAARALKAAWLRTLHPDWSEAQVQNEVRRIFLLART